MYKLKINSYQNEISRETESGNKEIEIMKIRIKVEDLRIRIEYRLRIREYNLRIRIEYNLRIGI